MTSYTIPQFLAMMEFKDTKNALSIKDSLKVIAEACGYLLHPSRIFLLLWNWTFELSYFICLLIALFGFFMVLAGNKDYKKYISGSIVSYLFINILNMFIVQ